MEFLFYLVAQAKQDIEPVAELIKLDPATLIVLLYFANRILSKVKFIKDDVHEIRERVEHHSDRIKKLENANSEDGE